MKVKICFVSNSSSSSYIIISPIKNQQYIEDKKVRYGDKAKLVVDKGFGQYKFGWEFQEYEDFESKLIFAYIQAKYMSNPKLVDEKNVEKGYRWISMIEKVVKEVLGVEIIWRLDVAYDPTNDDNCDWSEMSYIDHQSASYEGRNIEMFDSEEKLKDFLFNPSSSLCTGNDNE